MNAHLNFLTSIGVITETEATVLTAPAKMSFDDALANFIALCQEKINAHYTEHLTNLTPPILTASTRGKKYVRIVKTETFTSGRSVYCFIAKSDGAILKAASWKAPAKHARGCIYNSDPTFGTTVYGASYLR